MTERRMTKQEAHGEDIRGMCRNKEGKRNEI